MRAFLISDNLDSLVGLRLAGIEGRVARGPEESKNAIEEALEDPELGILVLTEKVAEIVPDLVQALRERGELPLVVEVPDRHGMHRAADFLTAYVRDAIGVNLG
ncbi:MAG: V-type ATP synthase subunit F [Synergistales bacterium]|jgi:V/A-type H+-transporting ATPase subunit F